jgi:hypothetical protein
MTTSFGGFVTPSAASGNLRLADLEGCLVVLRPTGPPETTTTAYGDGSFTPAEVLVVSGARELAGTWHELYVFAKAVQGQLRAAAKAGQPLVGTVGKGPAKPGQSPPWLLVDTDEDGLTAARAAYSAALKSEAGF